MTGIQAYILSKNLTTSILTGVSSIYFDTNGDMVVECTDGTVIRRPFKDIKSIEFSDETDGKHLKVKYSDDEVKDLGIIDPKFDISELITIGTTADEATATTPLFINIDQSSGESGSSSSGVGVADSDDLDDLWS